MWPLLWLNKKQIKRVGGVGVKLCALVLCYRSLTCGRMYRGYVLGNIKINIYIT